MRSVVPLTRGRVRSSLVLGALLLLPIFAASSIGCESSKLETGYTPRPLNASDAERRAYYSGKYTKESVKAEQEKQTEFRARRPGV